MTVNRLLAPDRVLRNVEARSKKHALEILSELLSAAVEEIPAASIFDNLVERERLGSTGLGSGVALPHGRLAGLEESVGAIVKLSAGIDFDSPDGEPVSVVFGLLVPEACAEDHLRDLSEIARLLANAEFLEQINATGNNRELYDLFVNQAAANEAPDSTGDKPLPAGGDATQDDPASKGRT